MTKGNAILLVEDNPDDADLTIDAFRRNHILNEVVVARDGAEALNRLFGADGSPPAPLPAIVILDLNLPRVPGLDVLRAIRANERTRRLPVVIMTTSVEQRDVIEGYELGANAYVQKPVGFEEFLVAAGRLGLFWLLVNVQPQRPD